MQAQSALATMVLRRVLVALLLSSAQVALANIEKTVFLGPATIPPSRQSALADLDLDVLKPGGPSLRTRLAAEFSKNESDKGTPSWAMVGDIGKPHWILLDNLRPGQRYEIRLCWSAMVRCIFFPPPFCLGFQSVVAWGEVPRTESIKSSAADVQPSNRVPSD